MITYAENCDGFLTNTKCEKCSNTFPVIKLDGSCHINTLVPNCLIYSNTETCLECEDDYEIDKGNCVKIKNFIDFCRLHSEGNIC